MRAANEEQILLVGSVPRPIGGVTQHVWRLSGQVAPLGCRILDVHPQSQKYATPNVTLTQSPTYRLFRLPWLSASIYSSRARVVHFHVSTPDTLATYIDLLLLRRHNRRYVLTLHHGDQHKHFIGLAASARRRVHRAIRSFDSIVSLSELQTSFYLDTIGVSPETIHQSTSFIRIADSLASAVCDASLSEIQVPRGRPLVVASGYAEPLYQHEWAIRLVDHLRKETDAQLMICLYGQIRNHEYLDLLNGMAATRDYVHIHYGLDFAQFLSLQRIADLYVRPTLIDSCGIAVWDSVMLRIPTVASAVCQRPPGVLTFPADDYSAFEAAAVRALQAEARPEPPSVSDGVASILDAYQLDNPMSDLRLVG